MMACTVRTIDSLAVPVDNWRPTVGRRANACAMQGLAHLGGALTKIFGPRAEHSFGILMHHRVAPLVEGVPAPPYNVPPQQFREQLVGLLNRGFRVLPLSEAVAHHERRKPLPERTVILTFDDCFESVYTQAWPIMQELQIPATLFLSTAYLDQDDPFPFDSWGFEFHKRVPADHYRPIRTEQCQEMVATGLIEVGTHTHTHADFRGHAAQFTDDLQISTRILDLHFGVAEPLFSLPFGSPHDGHASPAFLAAARTSGTRCALTTECSLVDTLSSPFGWGRIAVCPGDTSDTLAGKLDGWYDWAPRLKHRLAGTLKQRGTA